MRFLLLSSPYSSRAATLVDRAFASISTVKAFSAEANEGSSLSSTHQTLNRAELKTNVIFALSSASSQFVTLAMFVQGFWFGARFVREGILSAGDVMSVFFARLIAAGSLQMCIPQFIVFTKGKVVIAALMSLVASEHTPSSTNTESQEGRKSQTMAHARVASEFSLINVSFSYPSRPSIRVLDGISMFLPANETTFIVGGSGSGKSTVAQLLLKMYDPSSGGITLDSTLLGSFGDEELRTRVAGLYTTVYHNVAIGGARQGKKVSWEEAETRVRPR
jgi:ATP-binding cassette, subfamily B (MDR/TAP), member 1